MERPDVGMCFDRAFPAEAMVEYARAVETAGLDQLWVIEDCFFTAGISLAATALTATDRIQVGIGILPAVARNPAITAMEIATLAHLAPGRFRPGIGHGVPSWMEQIGERTPSPLTTLDETIVTVQRLLDGEEVSFEGREVQMRGVRLDRPPEPAPRILAGVQQERSLALAGRVAGGVILVEGAGPEYVRWSLEQAGHPDDFEVVTFTMMVVADDRRAAYEIIAPFVAGLIEERRPAFRILPFFDEMERRLADGGPEALLDMPADYWTEIGAIGTMDDAQAHFAALAEAGVSSVNVFPGDEIEFAWEQIETVARLTT